MAQEPARTLRVADHARPGFVRVLGPATEDRVRAAERRLGLLFPEPYRSFLLECGAAEVGTRVVYGIGDSLETVGGLNVVWHTGQARAHRYLDQTWLVLSSWDDLTLEIAKVVDDCGQPIDGP